MEKVHGLGEGDTLERLDDKTYWVRSNPVLSHQF